MSKKRTSRTLRKTTTSHNKIYKIALGITIALVSLLATGAYVVSKANKAIEETPKKIIDNSLDILLGLVGKKVKTKNQDGTYTFEDVVRDERVEEITKGLMSVPASKLNELWAKLKNNTIGDNKDEFQKTLLSFFKMVKESSTPLEEMAYDVAASAGNGIRGELPKILGGIDKDMTIAEIHEFLQYCGINYQNEQVEKGFTEKQAYPIKLFIGANNAFKNKSYWFADSKKYYRACVSAYNNLKTSGLKTKFNVSDTDVNTAGFNTAIDNGSNLVIDSDNASMTIDCKELVNYIKKNKLQTLNFGKRLKKRSKKRSKKNKKY